MEENPETSPYLQLARLTTHLSRTLKRRLDPPLRERLGLKAKEVFVLRAVETGESNPMRIAERLDIAPSSASRLLDRLVEIGLVARAEDPHDRRKTNLALTPEGRVAAHQARLEAVRILRDALRGLPEAQVRRAVDALGPLVAGLEPAEGPTGEPARG